MVMDYKQLDTNTIYRLEHFNKLSRLDSVKVYLDVINQLDITSFTVLVDFLYTFYPDTICKLVNYDIFYFVKEYLDNKFVMP